MGRRRAASTLAVAAAALASIAVPGTAASAHPKAPSRPTGMHLVNVASSSFTVAIRAVAHATQYRLYASTTRSDLFVQNISHAQASKPSSSPRISLTGLPHLATPYYYRVAAINNVRRKFTSAIGEVGLRPSSPSHLRAVSSKASTFVNWAGTSATSYQVEQATNAAMTAGRKVYTVHGQAHQFTPYGLQRGRTYYFRVRALNGSTPSAYSAKTQTVVRHASQSVRVMTYNVKEARLDGMSEGGNRVAPWSSKRKAAAASLISRADPDVVAVQEAADLIGNSRQVDTLAHALGGRYKVAHTENTPKQRHTRRTGVYIMYKKATYKAIGKGGHWNLGEKRSAAHQVLRSRQSGAEFLAVSTHLYQGRGRTSDLKRQSETTRLLSLGHALAAKKGIPVVYVGDFNSDPFKHHAFDAPARVMAAHGIADAYDVAQTHVNGRYNTANGYRTRPPHDGARIDYVWAPSGVAVHSWKLIMRMSHGRFIGTIPSDHNPLLVDLTIPV